ncbi:MAG: hypothetical protein GX304_06335 [Clostridiales bacterium]|jgi:hypothetical protein|nr:hypothetical protein [Clostridiales bacterium]
MENRFNLEDLISLWAEEAMRLLKEQGRDFEVKKISTFKLKDPDVEAVVKAKDAGGKVALYVCGFKSGKEL